MKRLTFLIFLFTNLLFSQSNELVNKLDSITTLIDNRVDVKPGTSIIITKNNKTLYAASNGLSSIELNTKNTINNTLLLPVIT